MHQSGTALMNRSDWIGTVSRLYGHNGFHQNKMKKGWVTTSEGTFAKKVQTHTMIKLKAPKRTQSTYSESRVTDKIYFWTLGDSSGTIWPNANIPSAFCTKLNRYGEWKPLGLVALWEFWISGDWLPIPHGLRCVDNLKYYIFICFIIHNVQISQAS